MSPEDPKRQPDEEAPRPAQDPTASPAKAQAPGEAAKSNYVFKIVRADPKNDFDFENVADK